LPILLAQLGEQPAADRAVSVIINQTGPAAGQYSQEIRAADDSNEFAVVYDWHAFDPPCLHQIGDFAESRQFADVDDVARHDVGQSSGVGLDVFGRQSRVRREPLAPTRVLALGAGFGPAQQIAFGDDPHKLAMPVYDGNAAYAMIDHERGNVLDRHFRRSRDDTPCHYINRPHASLLSSCWRA
jgi:hypothetical protein